MVKIICSPAPQASNTLHAYFFCETNLACEFVPAGDYFDAVRETSTSSIEYCPGSSWVFDDAHHSFRHALDAREMNPAFENFQGEHNHWSRLDVLKTCFGFHGRPLPGSHVS